MSWEVRERTRYALVCTDCGSLWRGGSWKFTPKDAEKHRHIAERYPCRTCENRAKVAALPTHHAHHEHNPDWPYPGDVGGPCCARMQSSGIGPYDCDECNEPWPCAASKALDGLEV